MKCIGYVSDFVTRKTGVRIPKGVSEIYNISQKNNRKFNITGLLSYQRQGYFQLLEGDDDIVDRLMANITADSRHENIRVIFDFPISRRSFPDWFMRLQTSLSTDLRFGLFIEKYSHIISSLDEDQKKLFDPFYHLGDLNLATDHSFSGKKIKLSAWPDFVLIAPSPENISLCGRLVKKAYIYEELLENEEFDNSEKLDALLVKLKKEGILILSDVLPEKVDSIPNMSTGALSEDKEIPEQRTDILRSNKSNSFYSKMKAFLKRGIK